MPTLIGYAIRHSLAGLEWAAGIPGTVAGCVVMNAGTKLGEMKDSVKTVRMVNMKGQVVDLDAAQVKFEYRRALLPRGIVVGVWLQLKPGIRSEIERVVKDYLHYRRNTQPLAMASAGCVFKNPPSDSAGRLIEAAGFKGARVGTVFIKSDTKEVRERAARFAELAALVLVGATFVALLLAALFQRAISRPIHKLLDAEKQVSRDKDYGIRVEKEADDEVGALIDGFNEMLGEIRTRDAEIIERHNQEMALARSIQTSVLPRTFELPGYDISAIMLPAEEVGGDFYEFRRTNGGAWLGVGDVTGHGVTSGLIMMMAQSMFTLLCEQRNGHQPTPSEFVNLLNRAMFYNLRSRLDQDKFMTMVIARIESDGRMTFAGAHTDLLIWRAANGSVERIGTEGLWLGVADDIAHVTADRSINLGRGDIALFHTDGVTEARNGDGECFDIDRLTEHLARMQGERAVDIVAGIADAAWNWWAGTPKDDVSLMAVKRE